MKKILLGVLLGFIVVLVGCNDDDGYSLDDSWVGFGVFKNDGASSYHIIMDNKDVLIPVASAYPPGWQESLDNGERILVNYTILADNVNNEGVIESYSVKVNSIRDVLMKGVLDLTPEIEDSIGNDPIIVEDYWMTDSLLNFKLKYLGYNQIHFLNLVKEPGEIVEADQPVELEIRHNANDDEEAVLKTTYVSFSLNSIRIEGLDSVQFVVKSTDYEEVTFSKQFVFDYSELELP